MAQMFSIGLPELAGFGVLGATAGASLSSWLVSGASTHTAAGCVAGAVLLPVVCGMKPQRIAAVTRRTLRLAQLVLIQMSGRRLAKGDQLCG